MKKIWIALFTVLAGSSLIAGNISWSFPPTTLSTANQNASDPQIATDGSGDLVAAWVETGLVKASVKPLNMNWGSAVTLSGTSASSPRIVSDANGNATAVWNEGGVIKAASRPSGGSWSSATSLSNTGASAPALAVDSAGDTVAAWVRGNNIESSTKLFGGSWSTRAVITSTAAAAPSIAMGGSGSAATAVVVWQGTSSGANVVLAASKLLSGSWSSQQVISDNTHSAGYAHVAVDANANALAVWYTYDLTGSVFSNVTVSSSSKIAGGSWAPHVDISASGIRDPGTLVARVAYDSFGNAIALWNNSYDGANFQIESSIKLVGAEWNNPVVAVSANTYAYEADLSVNALGDALAVYMFYNGASLLIQSAETDMTGFMQSFWSVPLNLGVGSQNGFPRVAGVLSGNTINTGAVWITENGSNQNIVAVTGTKTLVGSPSSPSVTQSSNNLGVFAEYKNTVSWTASTDPHAVGYLVYRNGVFIGEVNAMTTQFIDHNAKQSGSVTYAVAAVDAQQYHSHFVTVSYP